MYGDASRRGETPSQIERAGHGDAVRCGPSGGHLTRHRLPLINGSSKPVIDELRERVLAAVAALQYVPNAHAQLLARSHRSAVGVIVHDVSDPYFAEITRGLQRVATDQGRLLTICNSYRDPDRGLKYVELLRGHQVAALILAGCGGAVMPDNRAGGHLAGRELCELGHRAIHCTLTCWVTVPSNSTIRLDFCRPVPRTGAPSC